MQRPNEFSNAIQERALERQGHVCACCGTHIFGLGDSGREQHAYGEGARAHHVQHVKSGGTASEENCVILCQSCHYSVHEGGNYRYGTALGRAEDFPFYNG
jgi:5-methylcytosine-specific restriction endonuclease McrA